MCKFNICNEKNRNNGLQWANYGSISILGREKDGRKRKKMSKSIFLFSFFLGDVSAVATCRLLSINEFSC